MIGQPVTGCWIRLVPAFRRVTTTIREALCEPRSLAIHEPGASSSRALLWHGTLQTGSTACCTIACSTIASCRLAALHVAPHSNLSMNRALALLLLSEEWHGPNQTCTVANWLTDRSLNQEHGRSTSSRANKPTSTSRASAEYPPPPPAHA